MSKPTTSNPTETARSALMALEGRIHDQVADLYGRLGSLWNGLYLLIVASLLLAASNLGSSCG